MNPELRVGMNLLWLRPGEVGGSEVAAVGTVDALADLGDASMNLRLYAQAALRRAHPGIVDRVDTSTIVIPGASKIARVAAETAWLPHATRRDRIDVLHCYGGVVPLGVTVPTVLTVHDVQPLEEVFWYNSSNYSPAKRRWLRWMIPRSVEAADVVLVPSKFVRDQLLALVDVDETKIIVIPHGWSMPAIDGTPLDGALIRARFRLTGPFVLYPAITYGHKNHAVLIEAFAALARHGSPPTLVLTGSAGPSEAEVSGLIERRGLGAVVRRVGRVTDGELRALEQEAALIAFPSRYEGFGLPVLEGFALDTPVVASTSGSLPEVVGDAGVVVDPDDVDGWAEAVSAAIEGAFSTDQARARRLARADEFRWSRIVPDLVKVYRRVAGTCEK